MVYKIWRTLVRTAAAACFVVGSTAQAGGVFYQSDFDPPDFFGTVIWHVLDDTKCLTGRDGYYGVNQFSVFSGGPRCDVSISSLDYTVDYGGGIKDVLHFGPESETSPSPFLVAGIWVVDGVFAGADTLLIGPIAGAHTSYGYGYGVQFTSGYFASNSIVSWLSPYSSALANLEVPGAYLWEQTRRNCLLFNLYSARCTTEIETEGLGYAIYTNRNEDGTFPFPTRFEPIPEPGSLALLGGALVAGWFTRRRKAAA